MKKKRLTLFFYNFPPAHGGCETVMYLLAKYLSRKDWKVSVVTGKIEKCFGEFPCLYKGFEVFQVPNFKEFSKGKVGISRFLDKAYSAILKTAPDVIHSFNYYPSYIASIYTREFNIPLIVTNFDLPRTNKGHIIKIFKSKKVENVFLKHLITDISCNYMVLSSRYYLSSAMNLGIPRKILKLCYPGFDPEIFKPGGRSLNLKRSLGIGNKEFMIVVPARIAPRKCLEVLIRAVKRLGDLPVKVVLASGGVVPPDNRKYYNKIMRLIKGNSLENKFVFPKEKFTMDQRLGALYSSADIGILPSRLEGLGIGIIEVMASSVPVVGANTEGIKEVITHKSNGLLFKEGDSRDLEKCIRYLIDNERVRKNLARKAMLSVRNKFSLQKFIDSHNSIYKKAISEML